MLKVITKIRTLFFPFNLFVDEVSQGANSMMWSSSSGPGGGEGSGSFLSGGVGGEGGHHVAREAGDPEIEGEGADGTGV